MKKIILLLLLGISINILAQNINGRFSSSVYSFERFDSINASETYLRAYEMLNLNINYGKVSLRSLVNFESDVMTKQANDPRWRLYNLYFEARDLLNIATIKLGRQPIINSITGGAYDGAALTLKKNEFKLNAYFGGSVPAYQKPELIENFSDNLIYGGKFTTTVLQDFQFGLSYVNKNFKSVKYIADRLDANLNPIFVEIENKSSQYQFISGEVSFTKPRLVTIFTRFDYDLNFEEPSKFEFDARTDAFDNWALNLYYNYRQPKIRYNSIFAVFDYGNTNEIELGADYKINNNLTLIGKFGNVQYKTENSQRISLGVSTTYGSLNYRKTLGYAGELDAVSLNSAYTLFNGLLTPSVGLAYTKYKLSEDAESNHITTVLAGFNIRPYRTLSFDLQGQYMDNKIYKNDLRVFFKLNYWFNLNI